jgi:GNAT superfamily N-acetyltransferase
MTAAGKVGGRRRSYRPLIDARSASLPTKEVVMPVLTAPRTPPAEAAWRLADGRRVTLSPLTPADHLAFGAFLEDLTPASRRLRFLQAMPEIRERLVRQLVDVDQVDHVAWAARLDDRIVGEARYVRLRADREAAEIALAVAEDVRRVGLGRLLVESLGVLARADGIVRFTSTVADENHASTTLLRELGTAFHFDGGALEGRGPVPPWTGAAPVARAIVEQHRAIAGRVSAPVAA